MQLTRTSQFLSVLVLGASLVSAQGGRAGRAAQQAAQQPAAQAPGTPAPAPAATAGRGGRGGGAPAAATSEFYNYDPTAPAGQAIPDAAPAESHQKVNAGGEAIAYTARAGFLPVRNATTGQSEAHVFFTSYTKDGDSPARPLVFFLGGAPGVSAAWQDFGGLGPKRMRPASDGGDAAHPWADNANTLLTRADLIFVNPVGTAFSRPDQPNHGPAFWTTAADVASLAEFVRSYVARSNRLVSPLYLAADDNGTGRAAGLAAYLNEHDIPVRGVILFSMTLNADSQAGDAQYLTLLPSLTMAAWYQKKLSPDMNAMSGEQISGLARQFASRELLRSLYKGDRMTPEERTKAIADLSRFTGLSKQLVTSNDLRITLDRFNAELMRDQHRGFSPSDARVTGFVPPAAGGGRGGGGGGFGGGGAPSIDFNMSNLSAGFSNAYQAYLRDELTFKAPGAELFYLSNGGVGAFTSTGADDTSLSAAFARNPNLKLFLAVDYFDLAAPFYAAEYTLAHLNVSPEVRAHNITVSHLESGQMPYMDSKSLSKLQKDLASFVGDAAAPK